MSSPDSSRHDTFRLGSRTKAIMATHRPMAKAARRKRRKGKKRKKYEIIKNAVPLFLSPPFHQAEMS